MFRARARPPRLHDNPLSVGRARTPVRTSLGGCPQAPALIPAAIFEVGRTPARLKAARTSPREGSMEGEPNRSSRRRPSSHADHRGGGRRRHSPGRLRVRPPACRRPLEISSPPITPDAQSQHDRHHGAGHHDCRHRHYDHPHPCHPLRQDTRTSPSTLFLHRDLRGPSQTAEAEQLATLGTVAILALKPVRARQSSNARPGPVLRHVPVNDWPGMEKRGAHPRESCRNPRYLLPEA
ncbi:hypothetical protein M2163_000385 [Streptomyces sp. SAI-135]|nr:hypothetical protein [Streptomyces sp. SAI-090]MDH6573993.1 hypothetical protein [Streptomyces sp. SAI-117]MDH6581271.1 hypothetical protein [Streptomyces sp. SAI-133]MDH6613277.1 hypothetical protein [Streptomyces sp. SAI-135]